MIAEYDALAREVQALRQTVMALEDALSQQVRIALRVVTPAAYLGQPVSLLAEVIDARGEAVPGAVVTFVTTWGRLRAIRAEGVQTGGTLKLRTGPDGSARATLLPPLSEPLYESQQAALAAALRRLDPEAATPRAVEADLRLLVREYQWEASIDLRAAVDVFFREFRARILDTVNQYDYLASWNYFDSTVIAYIQDEMSGAVHATAALRLAFKDWLAPWMEVYLDALRAEGRLSGQLRDAKGFVRDAPLLHEIIVARMRDYVASQRGLAGEFAGRRVAETAARDFLARDLADLPLESRVALVPTLETAAGTIVNVDPRVFSAIGQTRVDLDRKIDAAVGQLDPGKIGGLFDRIDGLQGLLDSKLDRGQLDNALGVAFAQFETRLAADLDGRVQNQIGSALSRFETRLAAELQGRIEAQIGSALAGFEDRFTRDLTAKLDERFNGIDKRMVGLESQLDAKADLGALAGLEAGLLDRLREFDRTIDARVNARVAGMEAGLNQRLGAVEEGLRAKLDVGQFANFERSVNAALARKVETSTFDSFSSTVGQQITQLETRTTTLNTTLNNLNTSVLDIRNTLRGPR